MIRSVVAIVVDYASFEDSERLTLQLAQEKCNFDLRVIHLDNGNKKVVTLSKEQELAGISLIRLNENDGYAGGLIGAIESLKRNGEHFDAYWCLNCDLEIEKGSLSKLVQILDSHPRVGAVGPTVFKGRTEKVWGARGVVDPIMGVTAMTPWPQGGVLPKWSYIPGCSILVRQKSYSDAGGLPQRYRMYYEETELCIQLQKKNWDLWVEPTAKVYHAVQSVKAGIPARHFAFYFTRNNLYFWKRNFNIPWILQLPRTLFVVLKELVLPLRRAKTAGDFLCHYKRLLRHILHRMEVF